VSDFEHFACEVSRTELSLEPLDLNDHVNYQVANEILGGTQTWNRQSVRSPYVDGEYTVNAARSRPEERFAVQVFGEDQLTLQENIAMLIDAVSQFRFQLRLEMNEAVYIWQCETADYTLDFNQSRMMARQALVSLMIPRSPKLVRGGW
jgi:hypothetical protein